MATKREAKAAPKKPAAKAAKAELKAGAPVCVVKANGNTHSGAIDVLHADGTADIHVGDGTTIKGMKRAAKEGEKGTWSPA